jgi:hypothetical protein
MPVPSPSETTIALRRPLERSGPLPGHRRPSHAPDPLRPRSPAPGRQALRQPAASRPDGGDDSCCRHRRRDPPSYTTRARQARRPGPADAQWAPESREKNWNSRRRGGGGEPAIRRIWLCGRELGVTDRQVTPPQPRIFCPAALVHELGCRCCTNQVPPRPPPVAT